MCSMQSSYPITRQSSALITHKSCRHVSGRSSVRFCYATRRTESSWGRTKVRLDPSFRSGLTGCRSFRRQPGVWWPHEVHRKYICSCSNWSMLSWPCRPQNIWRTRSITRPLNPSISEVFACLTLVRVASGDRTERLLLPMFRLLLPPSTESSSKKDAAGLSRGSVVSRDVPD